MNTPDYLKIYSDMIRLKYPEKEQLCKNILQKNAISGMDIIRLNSIITGNRNTEKVRENQKLKSYDRKTILYILDYQEKRGLSNIQLARHFKLSRNTVTRWKKIFLTGTVISGTSV